MKQIKLGDMYYKMLSELAKKKRQNINNYINDLIVQNYQQLK